MLIGVSGKARAGKDEFASIAVGHGAIRVAFADGVKEEVAEFLTTNLVDWKQRNLYGELKDKEEPMYLDLQLLGECCDDFFNDFIDKYGKVAGGALVFTPRSLMQWWGTEYRRAQSESYWVDKAFAKCSDPLALYVISDVRFPNEARAVRDAGGALVRVNRPGQEAGSNPDHPSEISLDDWAPWDAIINNDNTLDAYLDACNSVFKHVSWGLYAGIY